MPRKMIGVFLPADVLEALDTFSEQEGRSVSDTAQRLIRAGLRQAGFPLDEVARGGYPRRCSVVPQAEASAA